MAIYDRQTTGLSQGDVLGMMGEFGQQAGDVNTLSRMGEYLGSIPMGIQKQQMEINRVRDLQNLGASTGGDLGMFGRGAMGIDPEVGVRFIQANQGIEKKRLFDYEEKKKKALLETAYSNLNDAIDNNDYEGALKAQSEISMIQGTKPPDVAYAQGRLVDQNLRSEGLNLTKEQIQQKKEDDAWNRTYKELRDKQNDTQFWAKYKQDQEQFQSKLDEDNKRWKIEQLKRENDMASGKVGAEAAGKASGIKVALEQLNSIRELYKSLGPQGIALSSITPSSAYNNILDILAENIGRVQSGGAINKEEEKRFIGLAKWSPFGESYEDKLKRAEEFLQTKMDAILSGGISLGEGPKKSSPIGSDINFLTPEQGKALLETPEGKAKLKALSGITSTVVEE